MEKLLFVGVFLGLHLVDMIEVCTISYRVTGLYRLDKTCYLHSLQCIIVLFTQFAVQ